MSDYDELLNRAIDQLPQKVLETKRFQVPKAYSMIQGNRTMIQNFSEIADTLNRDPQHILKFLLRELGTAGNLEGSRAIMQGKRPDFYWILPEPMGLNQFISGIFQHARMRHSFCLEREGQRYLIWYPQYQERRS